MIVLGDLDILFCPGNSTTMPTRRNDRHSCQTALPCMRIEIGRKGGRVLKVEASIAPDVLKVLSGGRGYRHLSGCYAPDAAECDPGRDRLQSPRGRAFSVEFVRRYTVVTEALGFLSLQQQEPLDFQAFPD